MPRAPEKPSSVATPCASPPWLSALLRQLAVPVMGCTEPAAIALATALAADSARGSDEPAWIRGGEPAPPAEAARGLHVERLQVRTVPSLYKNALAVGIPNAEGGSGIYLAAALGPSLDPGAGINLLKGVRPPALQAARSLLGSGRFGLTVQEQEPGGVFVEAQVIATWQGERHVGEAVIQGKHDRVTCIRRDGRTRYGREEPYEATDPDAMAELARCDLPALIRLATGLDEDARRHVLAGVSLNREAARVGLAGKLGLGVGAHLRSLMDAGVLSDDVPTRASLLAAAATDARMSGHDLEIMSSSGSGNQGLMAVLPPVAVAEAIAAEGKPADAAEPDGARDRNEARLAEGVALAHLVTGVMTEHAGLLSALCGCVVKAGLGAAAGCAHVLGLDADGVFAALRNMAGNQTGEICDGAKVGCAVKLSTAARAAVISAYQARDGVAIPPSNGILAATAGDLFANIGEVARSMGAVDHAIVALMEKKQLRQAGGD
jgi:L-cysteine desulfidase